jgi:L-asparaginase II
LFPKVGGEAIYAVGIRGKDRALVAKVDDGATRGLYPLVVALLGRLGLLDDRQLEELGAKWLGQPLRNWAGREVGTTRVVSG